MVDYTLNITTLIMMVFQLVGLGMGGLWFIFSLSSNYKHLETRLDKLSAEISELTKMTIQLARQEERMTSLDIRITELSRRLQDHIVLDSKTDRE